MLLDQSPSAASMTTKPAPEASNTDLLSENPCATDHKGPVLDDSIVYNGYTVGQLRKHAKRQKSYSRAAKLLMDMMFTEEERTGRCLQTYSRTKRDGTKLEKEGLEDQAKLSALQDIVQAEYECGTPRKVRKKLADKLKPSASADYEKKKSVVASDSE